MSARVGLKLAPLVAVLIAIGVSDAEAQRCVKGIPCGNTCISASKTCRVGSGTATKAGTSKPPAESTKSTVVPPRLTPKELDDSVARLLYGRPQSGSAAKSTNDTLFVGSRVDRVFFLRNCLAAQDLADENRRWFKTEKDALTAGYRRSRVPGC